MHTLKISVSLLDEARPDIELHLSANDSDCDLVIAQPQRSRSEPVAVVDADSSDAASRAHDAYVLGGYAGI